MPPAYSEPTTAPTLEPMIKSGRIPPSVKAFRTPTWANPRRPPEPRTSATRGGAITGLGGSKCGARFPENSSLASKHPALLSNAIARTNRKKRVLGVDNSGSPHRAARLVSRKQQSTREDHQATEYSRAGWRRIEDDDPEHRRPDQLEELDRLSRRDVGDAERPR